MDVLSPLDAAFLEAEDADERVSMAISSIGIFDGPPPSREELARALSTRLPLIPRYYQRVRRFPLDLAAPVWVNDPGFDIYFHVRCTALPSPGGEAELHALIGRVMAQRLDRDRPLWENWIVEGLSGGRWALISKVHHCMVDGVAGTELYHLLFSPSAELDAVAPGAEFEPFTVPPAPSSARITADAVWRAGSKPVHLVHRLATTGLHPRHLVTHTVTVSRGLASLAHVVLPTGPSILLGRIGRQRRYASTTVPLSEIKQIRRAFGTTVNDVALAAVTAGFRALLLTQGEEPSARTVRSLVPTNVRVPGTEGELANRVSCMFVDLPVHLSDPVERLTAVQHLVATAKKHHEAEAGETLVEACDYEPFAALSATLRAGFRMPQRNIVTVTTNVPGPSAPLYLLGRKMTRLLPFVPIADRVRVGVAMLSYCDELSFGVTSDYDMGADVGVLLEATREDLSALMAAAASTEPFDLSAAEQAP